MCPYEHANYRTVLRAWLSGPPRRSQERLARSIGTSRSAIAMVLKGDRNIPLSQARAWGEGLGLSTPEELTYWEALVRAEHGESLALRRAARLHVRAVREFLTARRPDADAASLFGRWYAPGVMELSRQPGFDPEPAALAARLWPEGEACEVEAALTGLRDAGLLGPGPVATDQEIEGDLAQAARTYHAAQLDHARAAMDTFSSDERYLASLTVGIRAEDLPKLVATLHRFQLEVVEPHRSDRADSVVQVSVQVFPRTRP